MVENYPKWKSATEHVYLSAAMPGSTYHLIAFLNFTSRQFTGILRSLGKVSLPIVFASIAWIGFDFATAFQYQRADIPLSCLRTSPACLASDYILVPMVALPIALVILWATPARKKSKANQSAFRIVKCKGCGQSLRFPHKTNSIEINCPTCGASEIIHPVSVKS